MHVPSFPLEFPRYFYPHKGRQVLLGLVSSVAGLGVFTLGSNGMIEYFVGGSFLVGACAFFAQLLPGSTYLKLDREGFTSRNLGRDTFTRWQDVESFLVVQQRVNGIRTNKFVGYICTPQYKRMGSLRAFNKAFTDCEGMLVPHGAKAEDLMVLLERYREHSQVGSPSTEV